MRIWCRPARWTNEAEVIPGGVSISLAEGPERSGLLGVRPRRGEPDNPTAMTMRIHITEPELLPDLVERLLRSRCVAHIVGERSCAVIHVDAEDAEEAWREVEFFVHAWRAEHPGLAALLSR